jgi:acylaminoacyl-peptidase
LSEVNRKIQLSNSFRNNHQDEDEKNKHSKSIEYDEESYHAIYVSPKHRKNVPLIIDIHDGPHKQSTTSYSRKTNFFLGMNMAVLSINYRGSTGMGDKKLESIMGLVSQVG